MCRLKVWPLITLMNVFFWFFSLSLPLQKIADANRYRLWISYSLPSLRSLLMHDLTTWVPNEKPIKLNV